MSYMSAFRRRLRKMESQGFIIPKYIKDIKLEKTARKYTYEKIAQKSKYKETYRGTERIISGEAGLERIRSASAKKAYETRKRREYEREKEDIITELGPIRDDEVEEWEDRKESLMRNITAIFDSFESQRLANKLRWLFDKRDKEDGTVFWSFLLSKSEKVVSDLQADAQIRYDDLKEQDASYNRWVSFLNYGTAPTLNDRKEAAKDSEG